MEKAGNRVWDQEVFILPGFTGLSLNGPLRSFSLFPSTANNSLHRHLNWAVWGPAHHHSVTMLCSHSRAWHNFIFLCLYLQNGVARPTSPAARIPPCYLLGDQLCLYSPDSWSQCLLSWMKLQISRKSTSKFVAETHFECKLSPQFSDCTPQILK